MATRNIEQDAAPERSVTGEESEAVTSVESVDDIAPEQEQTETDIDDTDDDADNMDDADIMEHYAQGTEDSDEKQDADEDIVLTPKRSVGEGIPAKAKNAVFDIMDTCESVLIAMFAVLLIFTYLFSVAEVEGDSMLPTLHDADRLLLLNLTDPEPGDIVVLNSRFAYTFDENGELQSREGLGKRIVKRLIATENQTVDIDFAAGIVYVDGKPLSEPYTSTLTTRDEGAFAYPITVPEGYVFVLGDNRSISKDSRHPDVALIPESDILGKVWLRVYPFDDFTAVS